MLSHCRQLDTMDEKPAWISHCHILDKVMNSVGAIPLKPSRRISLQVTVYRTQCVDLHITTIFFSFVDVPSEFRILFLLYTMYMCAFYGIFFDLCPIYEIFFVR